MRRRGSARIAGHAESLSRATRLRHHTSTARSDPLQSARLLGALARVTQQALERVHCLSQPGSSINVPTGATLHGPVIAKLVAPRTGQVVRRRRVLTAIGRGLRAGACWIAAPAGYGKTIAISDYLRTTSAPYVWYRIDEGDQDVASFFHYMAQSVRGVRKDRALPEFGAEYADQVPQFARRFFRSYLETLGLGTVLVLDDLHNADVPHYRGILAILLQELPPAVRCACVSRTLPPDEFTELMVKDKLSLVDESVLRFTDREALALVKMRLGRALATASIAPACGWAAGLVLLAERASAAAVRPEILARDRESSAPAAFAALAGHLIDSLPQAERDLLMKVSLMPDVRPDIVRALGGMAAGQNVLDALHRRQLLVTRAKSSHTVFHLHDLLREVLAKQAVKRAVRLAAFGGHGAGCTAAGRGRV